MTKYFLFSILIFSQMAMASGHKLPPNPGILDYMIEDYITHVPAHVRAAQANGTYNQSSLMTSFSAGLNICLTVVQIAQRVQAHFSEPERTVVQRVAHQQPHDNNSIDSSAVQVAAQSAVEALKIVNGLSGEQLRILAEQEENSNSDSHYFREKYAEYQAQNPS